MTVPSGRLMPLVGALILVLAATYFLFRAIDGAGLATESASADVVGKLHRDATRTYTTQVINGRTMTIPHVTPEAYVLELSLLGNKTEGVADRALYDKVSAGDQVSVTYQRRRVTRGVVVVGVSR